MSSQRDCVNARFSTPRHNAGCDWAACDWAGGDWAGRGARAVIVVAGEALIDLILLPDGSTIERPGGGPFNAARTIGRLGVPCAFLGGLSVDPAGERLRAQLVDDGVIPLAATGLRRPTGVAIARIGSDGGASYSFTIENSASLMTPSQSINAALALAPFAVHIGSLAAVLEPAHERLVSVAESLGPAPIVMVDPNCRPAVVAQPHEYLEGLAPLLGRCDILKVSREDLSFLFPGVEASEAARTMVDADSCLIIITDGGGETLAIAGSTQRSVPGRAATVVDTVGAGDAFGAALLAWWFRRGLERSDLFNLDYVAQAITAASEVAAMVCEKAGAEPPWLNSLGIAWQFDADRQ